MAYGKLYKRRGGVKPRTRTTAKPKPAPLARKAAPRRKPYVRRTAMKVLRPYALQSGPPLAHPMASEEFFDPLDKRQKGLPSPNAIGDHLVLDGVCRQSVTTSATAATYIIYQWTPTNLALFTVNGTTGVVSQFGVPQLSTANPTSIRPMRASLRLRNLTVFTSMAGSIRALSTPQQIEWEFVSPLTLTPAALASLGNTMNSHPSVRSYAQTELSKTKAWIIPPASVDGFEKYADFTIPATAAQGELAMINGASQVAQNLLIIQLNAVATSQTMDVALHVQVAARFPASTLYSNLTQDPVRIGADRYNAHIASVQANASEGHDHEDLENARKRRGVSSSDPRMRY